MRINLRTKTIIGIASIETLLLGFLIVTNLNFLKKSNELSIEQQVHSSTELIVAATQDAILSYDLATLDAIAQSVIQNPQFIYFQIEDVSRVPLVAKGAIPVNLQILSSDTSIATADDGRFDVFYPLSIRESQYGIMKFGLDISTLQHNYQRAKWNSIIIAMIELVLVALFSFILGAYLTRQLKSLGIAAEKIAHNDYNFQIKNSSKDEIGDVILAFNQMLLKLRVSHHMRNQYEAQLNELNATLENRIEKRNEQLNQKIQELVAANKALAHTKEQLVDSEKLASIGHLAAGIAHEINNPIGFIHSNLLTLQEYLQDIEAVILPNTKNLQDILEDLPDLLSESIRGTKRIKEIVSGLKSFSHQSETFNTAIDLTHCIQQALLICNNEYKYHCQIETDFQPPCDILGNSSKLIQVFTNLIINAAQAMPKERADGRKNVLQISSYELNHRVYVEFRDSGSGMTKDQQQHIFEPFYTTKPVGEGTGLGLSISYGIIKEHQGYIQVISSPNVGTRFIINFPSTSLSPH